MPSPWWSRLGSLALATLGLLPSPAAASTRATRAALCAAVAARPGASARIAVVSAFPAEVAPLIARITGAVAVDVDGRTFYTGEIAGVRVVLGITGIAMVNAATTAESLVAHFDDINAFVFSGVAGSRPPRRIADVTVPTRWLEVSSGEIFDSDRVLLGLARRARKRVTLERCGNVPPPDGTILCLPHQPGIFVGGLGESEDPYGGAAYPCIPGAGELLGCEFPAPAMQAEGAGSGAATTQGPVAEDEESAAVARVATEHGIPFVAFRAVSDGPADPLGLPGFPAQFLAYYRITAANAATSTTAMLDRLATLGTQRSWCPAP
jgi:nucleoside phosphorylase